MLTPQEPTEDGPRLAPAVIDELGKITVILTAGTAVATGQSLMRVGDSSKLGRKAKKVSWVHSLALLTLRSS